MNANFGGLTVANRFYLSLLLVQPFFLNPQKLKKAHPQSLRLKMGFLI